MTMRSPVPALVRTGFACALALAALAGCSKKTTAPGSRPLPEGSQNGQVLMMGWPEQASIWFTVADPGTPETPSDDFVYVLGADYWQSTSGVRSATLDMSQSNQLQAFRVGSDGNVAELFDFFLPPSLRYIGRDMDLYEFEDLTPTATPTYTGRGAVNGVVTATSPVSNVIKVTSPITDNLDFTPAPKGAANDSVLNVQFSEDPRALFYVLEINSANDILGNGSSYANERRIRGIPAPLQPGTRSLQSFILLMPAGSGPTGFNVTLSSHVWPLAFYIRVTAFDADGQMVNRVNDYFNTTSREGNLNLRTLEPVGGAVELLDPYPNPADPVEVPPMISRDDAFAILASVSGPQQPMATRNFSTQPPASGPVDPGMREAFERLSRDERLSAERLRADMAVVRGRLDNPGAPAAKSGRSAGARPR